MDTDQSDLSAAENAAGEPPANQHLLWRRRLAAALATVAVGLSIGAATLVSPRVAHANLGTYDRTKATRYADQWANGNNPQYPSFGNDCANFISQAMVAGGLSMVQGSNSTDDHYWYEGSTGLPWPFAQYYNSHSWSVVTDHRNFWFNYSPTPMVAGLTAQGSSRQSNSNVFPGDPVYYDWGKGEGISHGTILVAQNDYDVNSNLPLYNGDTVDGHTNARVHAMWTLADENIDRLTTTVFSTHVLG